MNSSSDRSSLDGPGLRVFREENAPDVPVIGSRGLSPQMRLSEFFRVFVLAVWLVERNASQKTRDDYARSIDYWVEFTSDPPLAEIDDFFTARYLQGLYALRGRAPKQAQVSASPYTIRKHCRNVQTCLSLAGPRTSVHRKAQRLIVEVPYLEKPAVDSGEVSDNFTLEELEAALAACSQMRVPKIEGVSPPNFWRALIAVAYNTAERRGALFGVAMPKPGAMEIVFPRGIRKGRRVTNRVPLNEHARAAIESIRTDRELLFPWPYSEHERKTKRHFARQFKRLLRLAGLSPERIDELSLHSVRKATGTEMAGYSPMGGMMTLGHQQWTTYQRHYAGRKIKADALDKLPQPARRSKGADDPRQGLLF